MADLRSDVETYGADLPAEEINAFFYFGYSQAQTFHAILEAAVANGDISRAGVLAAIDMVQDIDLGYGAGPVGYGPTPAERIPSNTDNIGVPVSVTENTFGLMPVTDFFTAPYMEGWDPAG
jgi:hypothetical protein